MVEMPNVYLGPSPFLPTLISTWPVVPRATKLCHINRSPFFQGDFESLSAPWLAFLLHTCPQPKSIRSSNIHPQQGGGAKTRIQDPPHHQSALTRMRNWMTVFNSPRCSGNRSQSLKRIMSRDLLQGPDTEPCGACPSLSGPRLFRKLAGPLLFLREWPASKAEVQKGILGAAIKD